MENLDSTTSSTDNSNSQPNRSIQKEVSRIFSVIFKDPIDGLKMYFADKTKTSVNGLLSLYILVFVVYIFGSALLFGNRADNIDLDVYFKIGIMPVLVMLLISVMSFILKSMFGKTEFRDELITGGVSGIPIVLLMSGLVFLSFFTKNLIRKVMQDPFDLGVIAVLVFFYIFILMINVFKQSLRANGLKDSQAFFLSPISIFISFYVAYKIGIELF
jgi:hypothetical protein